MADKPKKVVKRLMTSEYKSLIRGSGRKSKASLDKMFIARMSYTFGTHLEHWPIISNYHKIISSLIDKYKLTNEAHVWWCLIYTRDDESKINEFTQSGVSGRINTLGKIIREAILDKYPSINAYGNSEDTAIQKVYTMRVLGGMALPRHDTLTQIAIDLGYNNLFHLVKSILDREVKKGLAHVSG